MPFTGNARPRCWNGPCRVLEIKALKDQLARARLAPKTLIPNYETRREPMETYSRIGKPIATSGAQYVGHSMQALPVSC